MVKLKYIDTIETKLHKSEIEGKVREITLENHFFNIFAAGKSLCRAEFKENIFSFYHLSIGKHDMLSPHIHMAILEKKEGSVCNLYYSKTWEVWCLFIGWTLIWGMCIGESAWQGNVIHLICYMAVYVCGFFGARMHRTSICKKVVKILENQLVG